MKSICKKAVEKWGRISQLDKAIEELSELLQAVCKVKRRGETWPPRGDIEHLAEEIADVEIMIEQLKEMFTCGFMVSRWKDEKLLRLKLMVEGDEPKESERREEKEKPRICQTCIYGNDKGGCWKEIAATVECRKNNLSMWRGSAIG